MYDWYSQFYKRIQDSKFPKKKSLAATALAISATAVLATFVPAVGVPLGLFVAKITFAKVGAGTLL